MPMTMSDLSVLPQVGQAALPTIPGDVNETNVTNKTALVIASTSKDDGDKSLHM